MSAVAKGDYVTAIEDGAGPCVGANVRVTYRADEELVVTAIYSDHLNVRKASGGNVFRVSATRVRKQTRTLGEIPDGALSPDHPGIAWLFEDAARLADRLGLCNDYDRLCDALDIPGRVRTFTVDVFTGDGIKVTARVEARSRRLAQQRVFGQMQGAVPMQLEQIRNGGDR